MRAPAAVGGTLRRRILHKWNATAAPYPRACGIQHLIAAQAGVTPDAVAVADAVQSMTYAELMERADRLGTYLAGVGVEPETVVGVSLDRSVDMVVGLLGILLAGGAYVPLDPDYPVARLAFMVADAQAPVILTQEGLLADEVGPGVRRVLVDRDAPAIAAQPAQPPAVRFDPEQLAYVLYTSGSTGKPKGVEIPHRALVNFLSSMAREPGLGPDDVMLALTTLSFDIAGLELWLPLMLGARVVVAPRGSSTDPAALTRLIDRAGVSVVQATPATWRMLLDSGWVPPAGLKALCGGEALSPGVAQRLLDAGAELWNLYGPTEATVWSTAARLHAGEPVHIGRPIANTTVYILDTDLEPVPVGEVGDLYIGGDGLARGYRGRRDLTDERFVAHPFDPGERVYRTGDLARWRPDGTIDFLGRSDHQVKVRGFRIECGEVEAALEGHAGVRAAVVSAVADTSGEQRLVAYVTSTGEIPPAAMPPLLRRHVSATLPAYMVPTSFVVLDAFPLTPNGKVDRARLPPPGPERPAGAGPYVAPATAQEEALTEVWGQVLGLEQVGAEDDFFALGGHSLLAVQAVAAVRRRLGADVDAAALFEAPTPRRLATNLPASSTAADADLVHEDAATAPLSLVQEQMWRLRRDDPAAFVESTRVSLDGPFDEAALRGALEWLAGRQASLRTSFVMGPDGSPHQSIAAADVLLDVTDLTKLDAPEHDRRLAADRNHDGAGRAFDASSAPLWRAHAYVVGDNRADVTVEIDHLVCDETSLAILGTELAQAYHAFAAGDAPHLEPLPVQYADFARWERRRCDERRIEAERRYWRTALGGMPVVQTLPYDRVPGPTSDPAATLGFAVPIDVCRRLADLASSTGVTQYVLAVAAVQVLVARLTGLLDVVVLTTVDGRDRPELQRLIGDFANVGLLRADLSADPTFETILSRTRAQVVGLFAHRHVPFLTVRDDLVAALRASGIEAEPQVPVSVEFFHAAADQWAPGASVVAPPPPDDIGDSDDLADPTDDAPDPAAGRGAGVANPLSFWVLGDGQRLWGSARYHPEAFAPATAKGFVSQLLAILDAASRDPGRRLSQL